MISINEWFNMKQFNLQFANHSKLEQLKLFFLEHGTYIELKKGEQFSIQGRRVSVSENLACSWR